MRDRVRLPAFHDWTFIWSFISPVRVQICWDDWTFSTVVLQYLRSLRRGWWTRWHHFRPPSCFQWRCGPHMCFLRRNRLWIIKTKKYLPWFDQWYCSCNLCFVHYNTQALMSHWILKSERNICGVFPCRTRCINSRVFETGCMWLLRYSLWL